MKLKKGISEIPPFLMKQIEAEFWKFIDLLDWSDLGEQSADESSYDVLVRKCELLNADPLKVLEPVIASLSSVHKEQAEQQKANALLQKESNAIIFGYDEMFSLLLYQLDQKRFAFKVESNDEDFLLNRCAVLLGGDEYYHAVLDGELPFPALKAAPLLDVPAHAWARKNGREPSEYCNSTKFKKKSRSNKKGWR